jgi:hypothetical protein
MERPFAKIRKLDEAIEGRSGETYLLFPAEYERLRWLTGFFCGSLIVTIAGPIRAVRGSLV